MGRKLFDNSLFAEEPTALRRANVGITARLLGTCCIGAASASTKSPAGSKPRVLGSWEDCPTFDLEPVASRQASAIPGATSALGPTATPLTTTSAAAAESKNDVPARYRVHSRQQVPIGEAEQTPRDTAGRPSSVTRAVVPSVNALSSPQTPVALAATTAATASSPSTCPTAASLPPRPALASPSSPRSAAAGTAGGCSGFMTDADGAGDDDDVCTPGVPAMPTVPAISTSVPHHHHQQQQPPPQDSATDMYNSDNESLPAAESPLAQPHQQPRERQHMQHRLALRLLERRGVLPDGRTSASGSAGSSPASTTTDGGGGGGGSNSPSGSGGGGATGTGYIVISPNSVRGGGVGGGGSVSDYYSALSSPVVLSPDGGVGGGVMPVETAVQVDERLCLQDGEDYDPLDLRGSGYRVSAPGLGLRAAAPGRSAWAGGSGTAAGATAAAHRGGGADDDDGLHLRMRGSDFGGVIGGAVPEGVFARARARAAGYEGGGAARSAVVVPVGPDDEDGGGGGGAGGYTPRPGAPQPAWSAAGGRNEMSQEEKEWLFGQPGGIGGLKPVLALGEGGEGLVDLVRLDLPCRTLHLARKATRTCLPAFALSTSGAGPAAAAAAVLGVRSAKVSYRFPFEFFDREVKAMKAVKESGFVVRFQAAAYDHEAGQGFILMEAAPYGTLEDLHAALCRSQLQPIQRQRPALLQRAFAKFNFKSSAPPSLALAAAAGNGGGGAAAASPTGVSTPRGGGALLPHSPGVAGGAVVGGDRPSLPRPPPGGGIGSCGGVAIDPMDRDRFSCCSTASTRPFAGTGGGAGGAPQPAAAAAGSGDGDGDGPMHFAALGSSLMSTRALRYYGACMLQALVALHEAGYVYRDLKLSNILVCDGGRVRLTDFGAATPCLPDQPGLYGGAAGTRAYLAPEVLPWLEAGAGGKGGKRASGSGGGGAGTGGGPEPYTITVDSWTWGLVMVELATGWGLKELTQRIIRRVCAPRGAEPPDLPPDCGLPPALRQLLLDHVLVRDPRVRWPAARIRSHRFFDGLDWESLAEADGPHAHLFARGGRLGNAPSVAPLQDGPDAVAAAMLEGELMAAAAGRQQRGSRPNALAVAVATGGGGFDAAEASGDDAVPYGNAVIPFGPRPSGMGTGRPSSNTGGGGGGPPSPMTSGMLSPGGVIMSPVGGRGGSVTGRPSGALSPVLGSGRPSAAGRLSGAVSPLLGGGGRASGTGLVSPGGVRQSSSGNGGFVIGSVVVPPPGTPTPSGGSGSGPSLLVAPLGSVLSAGGAAGGGAALSITSRRHTLQGISATSRLSSGSFRQSSNTAPGSGPESAAGGAAPPPLPMTASMPCGVPQAAQMAAAE